MNNHFGVMLSLQKYIYYQLFVQNKEFHYPLSLAVENDNKKFVKYLLKKHNAQTTYKI
jgi:hypothetical protein